MGTAPTWVCPDCKAVVYTPHPMRFCPKCGAGPFPGWGRNPLVENLLAVARKTGFYKDLDSGDKDILYSRQIVKLHWKKGSSWAVSSPGMNTLLVPSKDLIAFKDPVAASKKYKAGEYWGGKKNPAAAKSLSMAAINAKLDKIPPFPKPRYYAPTANLPDPLDIHDPVRWKKLADSGSVI